MPSENSTLLQEAVDAARRGDREAAQILLRRASEAQPDNELVWLWLSRLAESADERIGFLRQALRAHPGHEQTKSELAEALGAAGIAAAKRGANDTAQELLREALELDPHSVEGWLWLATVRRERGEQRRCLERVLEIDPGHPRARALLQRPEFRAETGKPQARCPLCGAERPAESDRCPRCRAVLSLADLDSLLHNPEVDAEVAAAAVRTREELARWGGGVELHLALAIGHLNLGHLSEGLVHLKALSRLKPSDEILKSQIEILTLWQEGKERNPHETLPLAAAGSACAFPAVREGPVEESAGISAAVAPREPAAPPTLLAIDDSATVRKLVASSLEAHGYRVVAAGDASEGLSKLREHKIDLILLDIHLPGMDGYRVCKLIKSDPATAAIPVVMLSGRGGLFDRLRGRRAGAVSHLGKPFEPQALLELVRRACKVSPEPP